MKHKKSVKCLQLVAVLMLGMVLVSATGCSGTKKSRAFARAEKYYKEGDYEKARIEYMNVLRIDRQNSQALAGIGKIYLERGQVVTGYPFLSAARKLATNDLDIAYNLGSTYLAVSEFKKAKEEAEFVLAHDPGNEKAVLLWADTALKPAEITNALQQITGWRKKHGEKAVFYLAQGNLYLKLRDLKSAKEAVDKAAQLDPKSPNVMLALGNLHWAANELPQADAQFAAATELLPLRSVQRLRRIEFKLQTGAIAEAKTLIDSLTEKAPDFIPALIYQSKLAFSQKRFDDCLRVNERILAFDHMNYDAIVLNGRTWLAQRKVAEAIKEFERAKTIYAKSAELNYYIALANLAAQNIDRAIVSLTQSTTLDPNYTPAILLLAEWNLRKGNASSTIQLLAPVIDRQPKLTQAHLLLAAAYRAQDRYQEVAAIYQNLVKLFPKEAEPHYLLGLTYRHVKKTAEARKEFLTAHELQPKHVSALTQLIDMDLAENDFAGAAKRVEADLAINPKSPELYFLSAQVHLAQNATNKAEVAFLKALELDPAYRPAYGSLAQIYTKSKKPELALEKLETGIAKNTNDTVSMMMAASIYEEMKNYSSAAKYYEKAVSANPNFVPALNNLAYLYVEMFSENDKAYALAQKARELVPNDPYTADTLGWVLYKRGEYAWALKLIQECADKVTDNPEVFYHLGLAAYMCGVEQTAEQALSKALADKKGIRSKEDAQSYLAVLKTDASAPGAVKELEAILDHRPKDFIALLRIGGAYERAGQNDKAQSAYEKAMQLSPKSATPVLALARFYAFKLHNREKALEFAKAARTLAPDDTAVMEILGPLVYEARDYAWALTLLQKSNERRPDQAATLYYLGRCYFNLGKTSDAEKSMQQALSASPSVEQAAAIRQFLTFSSIYAHPDNASEDAIRATLQKDPAYIPALLAQAVVQEKNQKFAEAKQTYENVLALDPQVVLATKRLGLLYGDKLNDDPKAVELLGKVRQSLPGDLEATRTLGILASKRGDYQLSVQLLKEAVTSQSKPDASLLYRLGIAQYHLKKKSDSKESLHQALALNDKDKMADEARRILAELK